MWMTQSPTHPLRNAHKRPPTFLHQHWPTSITGLQILDKTNSMYEIFQTSVNRLCCISGGVEFELVKELKYLASLQIPPSYLKFLFKDVSEIIQFDQTNFKHQLERNTTSWDLKTFTTFQLYSMYLNIFQAQKLPGFGRTYETATVLNNALILWRV